MTALQALLAKLKALGVEVEQEAVSIAAIVWAKAVQIGTDLEDAFVAELPAIEAKLKDYALQVVASIAADPAFKTAAGDWSFGTAAARVWQLVVSDFPAAEQLGVSLFKGAVETAVQGAFAAVTTGNPISSLASSSPAQPTKS